MPPSLIWDKPVRMVGVRIAICLTRTWQAVDECDNTATITQGILVLDTEPPVLSVPAGCDGGL